jgi:DNA-binding MarR family transcriptional regulator
MTELSHRTQLSKSRLSHQIGRMERAGFVLRAQCPDDRRGQSVELTERGWEVLRAAAPAHVTDVRELFFDLLDEEQTAVFATALRAIADRLGQNPGLGCPNAEAEKEAALVDRVRERDGEPSEELARRN